MSRFPLLSCVSQADLSELKTLLDREHFTVLEIDGSEVRDARSFFIQATTALPLEPPLSGVVNWDAFSDSLWQGLDGLAKPRVALIWTGAQQMLEGGLPDLLTAVDVLCDVARSVRDPLTGVATPTEVLLFLVGLGPNFRHLALLVAM